MSESPKTDDINMKESIPASRVLGVFGMSIFTRREDLEKIFSEYGTVEKAEIVLNRHTGKSKGFGFVYFERQEDAEVARLKTNGLELNERTIRVDFSRTQAPHEPTPGFYNGKPIDEIRRERRDRFGGDRDRRRGDDRDRRSGGGGGVDRRSGDRDRDRRRVDRYDPDRHYVPRRSGSRERRPDSYRRNERSRSRSRSRSNDRSRDYNREYRPSRRSLSPRN